jgi:hypothetical protein
MKAKLYKVLDQYHLYDGDKAIATTIVGNPMLLPNLSKQNCDEIFGVVDVNSEVEAIVKTICPDDRGKDVIYGTGMAVGIQCFNKAIELNKDKVFTLEDMMNCWNKALKFQEHKQTLGEYIQFLQQTTEIEVVIVEQCLDPTCDGINRKGECVTTGKPKYDTDGCLILKIK